MNFELHAQNPAESLHLLPPPLVPIIFLEFRFQEEHIMVTKHITSILNCFLSIELVPVILSSVISCCKVKLDKPYPNISIFLSVRDMR